MASLLYFEKNLELLGRKQPHLADALRNAPHDRVEIFLTHKGAASARYRRNTLDSVLLHSQYDPVREARQAIEKLDLSTADYFVLLGFGLGYTIEALLERCARDNCHVFVVEPDIQILRAALAARDLTTILSLPHIHFAWPATGPLLAQQWCAFFDPVMAQKNVYITHAPSVALNPDFFKAAAHAIQSRTFQIFTDINTLVASSKVFLNNFLQNLPRALSAAGVSNFAGCFPKVPAIIVAAGPSLDRNIHELRRLDDRALILATDTALKPLLAAGVAPHFVFTGDPTYENFLHLDGAAAGESILVAECTAYPGVFGQFGHQMITCTFENSSLRSLAEILGEKGVLRAWGSVATMALDFALLLACDPIIFVGQDLSHSDGRTYCSGVYFEDEWFNSTLDARDWQAQWARLRASKTLVASQDIFGFPAESTDKLTAYWSWICKELQDHPNVRFINATEGGILRDTVEIMTLREAIHRYCSRKLDIRSQIQNSYGVSRNEDENTLKVLCRLTEECRQVADTLQRGTDLCRSSGPVAPQNLLQELEGIKESIYTACRIAPLLDCLNQMGNFAFLRRRSRLSGFPQDALLSLEIQATYSEYFASVRDALQEVNHGLHRIEQLIPMS